MTDSHQKSEIDPLDVLLAQPAVIADRGFSSRLGQKLYKPPVKREHVFMGMGAAWLLLASVFGSPRALLQSLESGARVLTSWISSVLPLPAEQTANQLTSSLSLQLTQEAGSVGQLISQSGMIGIYALGFLVLCAMFLLIRDQL